MIPKYVYTTEFPFVVPVKEEPLEKQMILVPDLVHRLKGLRDTYKDDKYGQKRWVIEKLLRELGYDDDKFIYRDTDLAKDKW